MPIRPENKALYPKDWPAISRAVKGRAGWKCEQCKAPHGEVIWRSVDMTTYMLENGEVHDAETGEFLGRARGSEYPGGKMLKVILTTAHLDHDPANCAADNLRALCQLHHLRYDAKLHASNARKTAMARKATGDLFSNAQGRADVMGEEERREAVVIGTPAELRAEANRLGAVDS